MESLNIYSGVCVKMLQLKSNKDGSYLIYLKVFHLRQITNAKLSLNHDIINEDNKPRNNLIYVTRRIQESVAVSRSIRDRHMK